MLRFASCRSPGAGTNAAGGARRCGRLGRWTAATLLAAACAPLPGCAGLLLDWPAQDVATTSRAAESLTLRESFESLPGTRIERAGLRILDDNAAAWAARWQMLADARHTIDISYFILSQDLFGMAFLGHLLQKAREGVTIRVLLDAQGMRMSEVSLGSDCLPALARADNVTVKLYRPLSRRIAEALLTLNPAVAAASNHDKIIVADGTIGLIGGRNIGMKYFLPPDILAGAFYDLDISLESPAIAAALTAVFERLYLSDQTRVVQRRDNQDLARCAAELHYAYAAMDAWLRTGEPARSAHPGSEAELAWRRAVRHLTHLRGALARPVGDRVEGEVRVISSLPRLASSGDPVTQSLFRLMRGAQRAILIENPYVVLTREAVSVFEETGRRGVDMTILTNSPVSSDNPLSQALFREQWPRLLAQVPRLRIYAGGTRRNLHSKFAIFDGRAALVGTYNLDPLSLAVNGELAVAVWSEPFAQRLAQRPRRLLAQGPPALYEYRIARAADGRPRRDRFGRVRVAFGPADHSDPGEWERLGCRWQLLRFAAGLPVLPPLF